jgi:hypothetical protein
MVKKSYLDPVTNECYSEKPDMSSELFFPAMYLIDDKTQLILEHVSDAEIHSLSVNIDFNEYLKLTGIRKDVLANWISAAKSEVEIYLQTKLPDDLTYTSDISDNFLSFSLPDYSNYPMMQTESIAEHIFNLVLSCVR